MKKLVIASHNDGKVREIGELLAPLGIEVVSAAALKLPEPVEDGDSFAANARLKSASAARLSGLPALADDSGLVVDALGGAPGIYSARWAGPKKDFALAMQKIEEELVKAGVEPQGATAHFVCALSLMQPSGEEWAVLGKVHGRLTFPPRGENGFGYDAIFMPDAYNQTFGEMSAAQKHRISHRANAFDQLINRLAALKDATA